MTKALLVLLCWGGFQISAFATTSKTVELETMEIPPFMSEHLPNKGAATYALSEVFKKMGYELKVRIVPVMRIRELQFKDPQVRGFFPSFVDDDFVEGLQLSRPFYETPWVIIERVDNPINWKVPGDLAKYKGGNVSGYTIRSQVRKIYTDNSLKLESAPDDATNLLKLANKRVDYVFTDAHVFKFLMATDPRLKPYAEVLRINPKIVALNRYGVAFKKDRESRKIMEQFNKVLNTVEFEKLIQEYIQKNMH